MPDNVRPPRVLVENDLRPTLAARAVMRAVEDLATERGLSRFRVAYTRNPEGEHVVALIFPPQPA